MMLKNPNILKICIGIGIGLSILVTVISKLGELDGISLPVTLSLTVVFSCLSYATSLLFVLYKKQRKIKQCLLPILAIPLYYVGELLTMYIAYFLGILEENDYGAFSYFVVSSWIWCLLVWGAVILIGIKRYKSSYKELGLVYILFGFSFILLRFQSVLM